MGRGPKRRRWARRRGGTGGIFGPKETTYVKLSPLAPVETAFRAGFFCGCGGQEPHGYLGARRKGGRRSVPEFRRY